MSEAYRSVMYTADRPDLCFQKGKGSWLWDENGKRYLDFVQGWAVNCLGHCPDVLNEALLAQANRLWNASPAFYNRAQIQLVDRLSGASGLEKVFLASTGAEANEGAIKLARKWGQKHRDGAYRIITMQGSFHGRTLATMSASGKAAFEPLFNPKVEGFIKVPLNDFEACAAAIDERVVGIMLEPIQGEAGVLPAEEGYLKRIAALCQERKLLLILDEIQTGMGRTGLLFAKEHFGITPDIMTLGKGLGGGAPLGALLAKESVACFEAGDQGGTFNGNALLAAVGVAVFDTVNQAGFLQNVRTQGAHLHATLTSIFGAGSVRGAGLLLAAQLPHPNAKDIVKRALANGLVINAPNADCLRFMPSLAVTREEIDTMADLLRKAL
ncbi:MAG: hypothetical protein RL385_3072 [Pseudomonadota bacterium]|jgi:acetylornithine/N-succinyldiaminopimelate aminotransferase